MLVIKPFGETPNQLLDKIKKSNKNITKISFAGRLDPMASGLMYILKNEECKYQSKIINLDKSYRFSLILGIETLSMDCLSNKIKITNVPKFIDFDIIKTHIQSFNDKKFLQKFPPFSSKYVRNVKNENHPLWWWTKNKRSDEIKIPSKMVHIKNIKIINGKFVKLKNIIDKFISKIDLVTHDGFNKETILKIWEKIQDIDFDTNLIEIDIQIDVSTGTYIRQLAHDIGKYFGFGGIAFDIFRNKIGDYSILQNSPLVP